MRNREQETILDELKFYPTVSVINKEANGGKHKFVEVRLPNGASHKLQWSSTANDGNYRRILNVRLMVRKRMRTLCIERVIPIKSKPVTNDVRRSPAAQPRSRSAARCGRAAEYSCVSTTEATGEFRDEEQRA